MLAACTGRTNVHFLHIRKTGGTALKSALRAHQITPVAVLHMHPHRIGLAHVPRTHRIIFVTRDPVARFVSGFGSRLRQGAPANHVPWTPAEERAFKRFSMPNDLALALNPAHPKHAEACEAMQAISHLRCSYWDWFGDADQLRARRDSLLFIGRIESFDADFQQLKAVLRLPDEIVLSSDARLAHRSTDTKKPVLDAEALRSLQEWYCADYEFIAFCEEWRAEQGGPVAKRFATNRAAGLA